MFAGLATTASAEEIVNISDNNSETSVYYIDVSPEEWEETYTNHPYFKNPDGSVVFRLKGNNKARAICYKCGRSSMSLQQEWRDVRLSMVTCPGNWYGSDQRYAIPGFIETIVMAVDH